MSLRRFAFVMLAILGSAPTAALSQEALQLVAPGAPLQFQMEGQSAVTRVAVDVPAGTRQMRLSLLAANPAQKVDLYTRGGSPFELRGAGIDPSQVIDQSQYRSTSRGGDEFVTISDANPIPLTPGRWYIAVINWSAAPATVTLQAEFWSQPQVAPIQVRFDLPGEDCDVAPWDDASPRTPVRGNNGTTLGQQRRLATLEAARLLSEELRPRVPIRVRACWRDLGAATGNSFTLANAGPTFVFLANSEAGGRRPTLERPYTWYVAAAAAQQIGTDLCRFSNQDCASAMDIRMNFNVSVDSGSGFDYGFIHAPGAPSSFISVAMHEIAHGLGIFGLVTLNQNNGTVGAQPRFDGQPYAWDDIYGAFARWTPQANAGSEFLRLSDAERVLALSAGLNLRFAGPNAVALNPNRDFGPPASFVSLHAPSVIAPGSTFSHIASGIYPVQLMTASISSAGPRELGIALGMLRDVGFTADQRGPRQFPSAPSYQYYDPARNGHGIDFRLISPSIAAGLESEYFMGFYTFDAQGEPEWYIASGPMVDGVFVPATNEFGDSLLRMRYQGPDQSIPDASAEYVGRIRLDFNGARAHPACLDGHPARNLDGPLAVMSFQIGSERLQWCMQPVVTPTNVQQDFSSIWYSLGDGGWGLAIQSFDNVPTDGLFSILYYADAQGLPRWAIAQEASFQSGATYPLRQVRGYCRTCPSPAELEFTGEIGSIQFGLVRGGAGSTGNTVSFDVTYPGPQGGRFTRDNVDLFPNSDPAPPPGG